jgi:hypothetical protein
VKLTLSPEQPVTAASRMRPVAPLSLSITATGPRTGPTVQAAPAGIRAAASRTFCTAGSSRPTGTGFGAASARGAPAEPLRAAAPLTSPAATLTPPRAAGAMLTEVSSIQSL